MRIVVGGRYLGAGAHLDPILRHSLARQQEAAVRELASISLTFSLTANPFRLVSLTVFFFFSPPLPTRPSTYPTILTARSLGVATLSAVIDEEGWGGDSTFNWKQTSAERVHEISRNTQLDISYLVDKADAVFCFFFALGSFAALW